MVKSSIEDNTSITNMTVKTDNIGRSLILNISAQLFFVLSIAVIKRTYTNNYEYFR